MTKTEFPTKVTMVPTESHRKSNFRAGLTSSASSARLALAAADVFCGRGFPPGPVTSVGAAFLDAVAMLWITNATRKTAIRMIGDKKRMYTRR
jgi:hypothetical protein